MSRNSYGIKIPTHKYMYMVKNKNKTWFKNLKLVLKLSNFIFNVLNNTFKCLRYRISL